MMSVRTVEDDYQFALKEKEKLARKQSQQGRGRSPAPNKGKGVSHDKHINPRMKLKNHTVTRKEEEDPEEEKVVEGFLL
jgi:hypothetical protein